MRLKGKIWTVLLIALGLSIIHYVLPDNSRVVNFYDNFIFLPFQSVRNTIFSVIPISVGDIFYILGGLALVLLVGKWIYFLINIRNSKLKWGMSLLHTFITAGLIYSVFLLGWGGIIISYLLVNSGV